MKKVNKAEFERYFDENLAPKVKKYEIIRKIFVGAEVIIMLLGIVILYTFGVSLVNYDGPGNPFGLFACVLGGVVAGIVVPFKFLNWIYKDIIKINLYKVLFDVLDLKYYYGYGNSYSPIKKVCAASGIFNRYDNIDTDDTICGDYDGLPFKVSDIEITYTGTGENRSVYTVFSGLYFATTINKNFQGEMLIKSEQLGLAKEILGKKRVKLEDVEFEKDFEVYGTDQIDARYLLTTAFMNRLLSYKRRKGYKIDVFFSNKVFTKSNVYFFIHTNKDHFEIPINKNLLNKDSYYNIIEEIVDIMEVVKALKLDQNIGL